MKLALAGDMHLPWPCRRTVAAFLKRLRHTKPDVVAQMGDLYDAYSWGKFPRSHCVMTPAEEIKKARKLAEDFWEAVRAAAPKARLIQLLGNHDARPAKRLIEQLPEFEPFADTIRSWWSFDGVETQKSERDEVTIGGVMLLHGYRKHGTHVTYNLMNTALGHTHLGGVVYLRHQGKSLWELNCGLMGDPSVKALSYTAQSKVSKWTRGWGEVDDYGPRFIAYDGGRR